MSWIKKSCVAVLVTLSTTLAAQQLVLDGQFIDLEPNSQVVVDTNGNVVITSDVGDLTCLQSTTPPTVQLLVNGASSTSIPSGNSVTVSWNHQFADTCSATGGSGTNWQGTNVNSPTGSTILTNVTQSTSLTLSCSNLIGNNSASATISIQGTSGGPFIAPADCPTTAPPPAGTERIDPLRVGLFPINTVANTFEGMIDSKWPGQTNNNEEVRVPRNQYLAVGFNTGDSCSTTGCDRTTGSINWVPSAIGNASALVSISRCPGDFSPSLGNCIVGGTGPLIWSYSIAARCLLQPDEQYFLNMINASITNPSVTTCQNSECGWLVETN